MRWHLGQIQVATLNIPIVRKINNVELLEQTTDFYHHFPSKKRKKDVDWKSCHWLSYYSPHDRDKTPITKYTKRKRDVVWSHSFRGFRPWLLSPRHWAEYHTSNGGWQKPATPQCVGGTRTQVSPSKAHPCDRLHSWGSAPKISMTSPK